MFVLALIVQFFFYFVLTTCYTQQTPPTPVSCDAGTAAAQLTVTVVCNGADSCAMAGDYVAGDAVDSYGTHTFMRSGDPTWRIHNTGCGWNVEQKQNGIYGHDGHDEWQRKSRTYKDQCVDCTGDCLSEAALNADTMYNVVGSVMSGVRLSQFNSSNACVACPVDTFSNAGATSCVSCAQGTSTNGRVGKPCCTASPNIKDYTCGTVTAPAPAPSVSYFVQSSGTCASNNGMKVDTQTDCDNAAQYLGFADTTSTLVPNYNNHYNNNFHGAGGCTRRPGNVGNNLYFNPNYGSYGSYRTCSHEFECLCKTDSGGSSATAPAPSSVQVGLSIVFALCCCWCCVRSCTDCSISFFYFRSDYVLYATDSTNTCIM